ncbi:MAG TPA: hypothetical protein VKM93_03245 [Terriglobia bacterium]|nr:hypothetical protein [Terriglobia bacterium]
MFFPGSRYANMTSYTVTRPDGVTVSVTRLPLPVQNPLLGFHQRQEGQRLDLISSHYLSDATTFWRLCDANDALVPDSLAVHDLIGIPGKGQG